MWVGGESMLFNAQINASDCSRARGEAEMLFAALFVPFVIQVSPP